MAEEIDLRPYILALISHWRTLAIVVVAAAIAAMVFAFALPTSSTASADVLILPSRSQLTFDSRFVTNSSGLGTDVASRQQALIALATSPALEEQVLPNLPSELVGNEYRPGDLAGRIRVEADGDLLHIAASAADAQGAQTLALAWGKAYVQAVNDLYSREPELVGELETQMGEAQKRYDDAQRQLETFVGSSTIVQVGQQISMTTELLNESRAGTQGLYAQYLSQARELEATLLSAETLRQQVAAGQTEGLANSLASLALRARAIGDVKLPIDLRFDDPGALAQSSSVTLADLDSLIGILRQRRDALMEQSQLLAQAVDSGKNGEGGLTPSLRDMYTQRLSQLNQQYEQQSSQLKLLRQRRDLTLESLSILQRKLDEQRVALGASEVQVRFISAVVEPPRSALSRMILYGVVAGFMGLVVSALVIVGQAVFRPWLPAPRSRGERPLDRPTAS
jgi:uncharacterized protein involved in exopolysaccharide biosynthesis